jgi:hypothetical protein
MSSFRNFLQRRRSGAAHFMFGKEQKPKRTLAPRKGERSWERKFRLQGVVPGRNVSRFVSKRPLRGHMKGAKR